MACHGCMFGLPQEGERGHLCGVVAGRSGAPGGGGGGGEGVKLGHAPGKGGNLPQGSLTGKQWSQLIGGQGDPVCPPQNAP